MKRVKAVCNGLVLIGKLFAALWLIAIYAPLVLNQQWPNEIESWFLIGIVLGVWLKDDVPFPFKPKKR